MKILYIGEMGDAVNNLISLSKITSKVVMVNTSLHDPWLEVPGMKAAIGKSCEVHNFYESDELFERRLPAKYGKIYRYFLALLGVRFVRSIRKRREEFKSIKRIIETENFQIAFAVWGIGVIPDITFLRAVDSHIPTIHYIPTFPTSQMSWFREKLEIALFGRVANRINGYITGSPEMKKYFVKKYGIDANSIFVGPIFYSSEYFAKERLPLLSDSDGEPHLVFTGSPDFSEEYNNVATQIAEIANAGIHVHCGWTENSNLDNAHVHYFDRFDTPDLVNGSFATFLTQFDGCLVLYNGNSKRLRYRTGTPQRFLSCFTAGVPVFIPRGTFANCEEITESYNIGCVYNNVEELRGKTLDREFMETVAKRAQTISKSFCFEDQAKELVSFLSAFVRD